jgi:hypothetical protein
MKYSPSQQHDIASEMRERILVEADKPDMDLRRIVLTCNTYDRYCRRRSELNLDNCEPERVSDSDKLEEMYNYNQHQDLHQGAYDLVSNQIPDIPHTQHKTLADDNQKSSNYSETDISSDSESSEGDSDDYDMDDINLESCSAWKPQRLPRPSRQAEYYDRWSSKQAKVSTKSVQASHWMGVPYRGIYSGFCWR